MLRGSCGGSSSSNILCRKVEGGLFRLQCCPSSFSAFFCVRIATRAQSSQGGPSEGLHPSSPSSLEHQDRETLVSPLVGIQRASHRPRLTSKPVALAEDDSSDVAVYPGKEGLPPLVPPAPISKFSFLNRYEGSKERNYFAGGDVPNSVPKPKLPSWSSSFTHPALRLERLERRNWISRDAAGYISEASRCALEGWLKDWMRASAALGSSPQNFLDTHVQVFPRRASLRGVYSRRNFSAGEEVFSVPLRSVSTVSSEGVQPALQVGQRRLSTIQESDVAHPGLPIHTESLALSNSAPAVPSFEKVLRFLLSLRRSSLDPTPHLLFVEQVYLAMQLAVEAQAENGKEAGGVSEWAPYLQLLRKGCMGEGEAQESNFRLFDDDDIVFLHRGVLEPQALLEYTDHTLRFQHMLRGLHRLWWEDYEEARTDESVSRAAHVTVPPPPPSLDLMEWALRVVLSRQVMVPHLRDHCTDFEQCRALACALDNNEPHDAFARQVMRCKWWLYEKVFRTVDPKRLRVNEDWVQAGAVRIPTIVPLLDLVQHPPGGRPNCVLSFERREHQAVESLQQSASQNKGVLHAVVHAGESIEEDEEITLAYPKCFSVSYTLFRYGTLVLNRREADEKQWKGGVSIGDSTNSDLSPAMKS